MSTERSADEPAGFTLGCHGTHVTPRNDRRRRIFALGNAMQERIVEVRAGLGEIRRVHGPADVTTGPDEAVVLSIGRDSAPWIPAFIEHHLELGARHIFYLDNSSSDDSVALASRYDHVTVLTTDISFRRYEVGLRRWITRRYGRGRWSLYCDIDELFDYPLSDRLPLGGLLRYLRHHGYRVLTGQMLDLVSDRPLDQLPGGPNGDLKTTYRYYDLTDLQPTRDIYWIRDGLCPNPEIACYFGGIRRRFFGDACLLLTKHPLVYAAESLGVYAYDGHFTAGAPVADISAVLRHYKYIGSLPERVQRTVDERWHHKVGPLYGGLASVLGRDSGFSLRPSTAREYTGTADLVDQGLLVVTDSYREWVRHEGRPGGVSLTEDGT